MSDYSKRSLTHPRALNANAAPGDRTENQRIVEDLFHVYWHTDGDDVAQCDATVARARELFASAPVEAGTAALDEVLGNVHRSSQSGFTELRNRARSELLALKRAAAGRDAVIEECAKVCDAGAKDYADSQADAEREEEDDEIIYGLAGKFTACFMLARMIRALKPGPGAGDGR